MGCGVCGEHLETPSVVSDDGVAEIRCGGRLEEKEWKTLNRSQAPGGLCSGRCYRPTCGQRIGPNSPSGEAGSWSPPALARLFSASTLGRVWGIENGLDPAHPIVGQPGSWAVPFATGISEQRDRAVLCLTHWLVVLALWL